MVFIPQTWFLDSTGKLLWIHEGYGGDANWQETMTAKLDEVVKRSSPSDEAGLIGFEPRSREPGHGGGVQKTER